MNIDNLMATVSIAALVKPLLAFIPLITGIGGAGVPSYTVSRSLRARRNNSAYMTRVPAGAGNRQTWTWSGWIKLGAIDPSNGLCLFTAYNNTSGAYTTNEWSSFLTRADGTSMGGYFDWLDAAGGGIQGRLTSNSFIRDPDAWYHLVFVFDSTNATSTERMRIYLNGNRITSFSSATYPAQNANSYVNSANMHSMGIAFLSGATFYYYDGYLSDIHFVDGQALSPSVFAENNVTTGVWSPKAYTGSHGTNGFWLTFANNASTTTLGYDDAGGVAGAGAGSNDWTLTNFSVTAGSTNDSVTDSPTNYGSDTGAGGEVRGNYCVLNPHWMGSATLSEGFLKATSSSTLSVMSTFGLMTGKWYFEFVNTTSGNMWSPGIAKPGISSTGYLGSDVYGYSYASNGSIYNNGSSTSGNATYAQNDVIGVAIDMDGGTVSFYKNGTLQGTSFTTGIVGPVFPAIGGSTLSSAVAVVNFGQRPFSYTAPSGYKAICTHNLPNPTIIKSNEYFDLNLRTGTGASFNVTGKSFTPDMVWAKSRSGATDHAIYDSVRGVQKRLETNNTDAEVTGDSTGLTAFNSDGFSAGALAQINTNAATYVDLLWKKSATAGIDVVAYSGDNTSNKNISHSLGVAPSFAIIKRRDSTSNWWAWHTNLTGTAYFLNLNGTAAQTNTNSPWGTGNWSSSQFMVSNNATENANATSGTYVAYLFSNVTGFSRFGSYAGNGSTNGPFVWCGFKPKFIMIKRADSTSDWYIFDSQRETFNVVTASLLADTAAAETYATSIDILANGFICRSATVVNASGGSYIFAAFAEAPFKYSRAR